jgi:hypothetical protein
MSSIFSNESSIGCLDIIERKWPLLDEILHSQYIVVALHIS